MNRPGIEITESRFVALMPCKVSPKLIQDLAAMIRDGSVKLTQDVLSTWNTTDQNMKDNYISFANEVRIVVEESTGSKEGKITKFSSPDDLTGWEVPADVTQVSISSGNERTPFEALLKLSFDYPMSRSKCEISVKGGRDKLILDGLAARLQKRLAEDKTSNIYAYRLRYTLPITALLALPAFWIVYRLVPQSFSPSIRVELGVMLGFLAFSFALMFGLIVVERLLAWMFPFFSYSGDKRDGKRKVVKGLFVSVAVALVSPALYDMVRLLFAILTSK